MTANLSLRAYTGAGAATESAAQSSVALVAADALAGPDVAPGSRSFERWLRLRVDAAPALGVTGFWLQNEGDLPDGVTILFGVADTPATPVDTPSTVAVKTLMAGERYVFDNAILTEVGEHTRYIVIQEVVAAEAASGAIPEQALTWGWSER